MARIVTWSCPTPLPLIPCPLLQSRAGDKKATPVSLPRRRPGRWFPPSPPAASAAGEWGNPGSVIPAPSL